MATFFLNSGGDTTQVDAIEKRIRRALPGLVRIDDLEAIAAHRVADGASDPAYVLIAAPGRDPRRFADLLKAAEVGRDDLYFILISDEISASDYKALTRTGAADWVSFSADAQEILDIIARHRRARAAGERSAASSERKASAVAFVPSAGGVGNSTLIVETAVYLKTRKPTKDREICIIDLDFQSSHVCDLLDIEPRLKIGEISSNPERLDEHLFEIFISRHSSGIHVFAAPRGRFDYCALDVTALDAFMSMAAARYDVMLIDLPLTHYEWTAQLISASDRALVTGLNTVPGLRQAAETVADIRGRTKLPGHVAVAINRCERRLIGGVARRRHVESLLPGETVFFVGEEPAALQSINTGVPMMLSKTSTALEKEIAAVARFCGQTEAEGALSPS